MRRWPRRVLISANVLVALAIISAGSAFGYFNWRLGQIKTISIPSLRKGHTGTTMSPFTMLVVGSDTRNLSDGAAFGGTTGPQGTAGQRSDTIMLMRVVPATKSLTILSIPRDLYVNIQGLGMTRINAAFGSGPDLLISTIESDLGIPIDHYVEVNFDTFRQITDAIGGVPVYFPTPVRDMEESTFHVTAAGCVNLTGDQALNFARSRFYQAYYNGSWHADGNGDLARIQRQQFFVRKMIAKAKTQYTDPLALNGIIGGLTKNLKIDSNLSTSALINLATTFRSINPSDIQSSTLPNDGIVVGGADYQQLQQPAAGQAIAAFNSVGIPPSAPTTTTTVPLPATPVAPSSVAVEVANGSGIAGQAGQASSGLAGLGYRTTTLAAPGSRAATTTVRYAPDSLAAAEQVVHQIAGGATLVEDPSLTASPYNLEVVTGTSFAGITGTGASTASGASATAAPTTTTPATTVPPPAPKYILPPYPPLSSVPAC